MVFTSEVLSREFRILEVCLIWEETTMEVKVGRWDIYNRVPAVVQWHVLE
jgi:hypothetical protein